ncbi:MAG: chloride channel protein [Bacteroidetes bacterium]|nr:chloride channel protein [Bacteroidota bacterium]MBU1719928.1 chloride channel protein [Bacteroidota bacterium]
MGRSKILVGRFLIWRARKISDRYFVIILAAILGVIIGLCAFCLKGAVFQIEELLTGNFKSDHRYLWYAIYPAIGIWITLIFIRFILRDGEPYGIPRILYVISRNKSRMKRHKPLGAIAGASLTAGFGGSIGLESPIITAGSSIGSILAQFLRLNYRTTTLLIGAGAAGAISSIFNTPVAAVIFSLEVLMLDLTTLSIIPLLVASVAGAITTKMLFGDNLIMQFDLSDKFDVYDVPYYLLLGGLCGLVSLYFNKTNNLIVKQMDKIRNVYKRSAIGVITLGALIFIFPSLYGEGYDMLKLIVSNNSSELLDNTFFQSFDFHPWMFVLFVVVLMLVKVVATSLTIESGGIGGIFAPAAVMGGLIGFAFARSVNQLDFGVVLSEPNFTMVGMAGVLGGVLHAPLTAMFLVAELTNGYELIVPLMIITAFSYTTIKYFDPHSIFTRRLAERGELLTHHKDQTVLTLLSVKAVIDTNLDTIKPGITLGDLVKVIAKSKRNIFPVIDNDGFFLGLIAMDDVREDMFHPEKYGNPIAQYIIQPLDSVSSADTMEVVVEKFRTTKYYNLPVIDQGKYVGFVSRATLFSAYRQVLIDVSHE